MGMRHRMARVVGRLVRWGLHDVLHRNASQLPGRIALAIDPAFIASRRQVIRQGSIVVCGTNGKTTTTNMLAASLEAQGWRVLCNRDGANMAAGVASALLGKGPVDWAVMETDELSTPHVVPSLQPTYLVLLNLFRDQLDRAGEIDHVQDVIAQSLVDSLHTTLVACGDDPLCMGVAERVSGQGTPVLAFGMGQSLGLAPERVPEARFCQRCGTELGYAFRTYAQLGRFACPACGFATPELDFCATHADVGASGVSLDVACDKGPDGPDAWHVHTSLGGAYMAYNLLAVVSAASLAGANALCAQQAIDSYAPANGRLQHFAIDAREVVLNLAKNPTGLNQNLSMLALDERRKELLVIINDDYNDGRDISWIWDVDFERLAQDDAVATVMAAGHRANDLQVRLKYAGVAAPIVDDVAQALEAVACLPTECPLYVLTNYSALWPAKAELEGMVAHHG
ncbi:MAG: MurT ligase domain-containing protein [Coriobacteriales bacterium]|nr:MurT ligase domain-containing protein [Coriobacteriales bacterium]